jgi:hypothetical protein
MKKKSKRKGDGNYEVITTNKEGRIREGFRATPRFIFN